MCVRVRGRQRLIERQCAWTYDWWQTFICCSKKHFASLTAEDLLRACVDLMCFVPRAQMIHGKKRAHMHVICGVKSGISLNYYYRENETCILCVMKWNRAKTTVRKRCLVLNKRFKHCPSRLLSNCFCCSNQESVTKHTRLLQFLSASYNHISGQCTPKGFRRAGLMNRLMVLTPRGTSR